MATRSPANSAGSARCVAVDLGPRFVRVVEVEQSGAEIRMARRGSAVLPAGCWNEVGANKDGMAAAIREALSTAGISTKSAVACLPRRLVTVRFARLPQAPPEQIRGMIEFEAQQYILFPLNEVILDYHVPTGIGSGLSTVQDDMQTVLLAAARRSLVSDIQLVFDRAGVELTQLSVSALALAEHVRDSLEPTAVIALESGAMDVSVVADGQLLFTRSSSLEVAGIAREVAARRFSEEVARSFTAYQNEFRQKPLAHVYLCGSETATNDGDWMDQALVEALEKPVARLHSRLLPASDPDATSYAIAAGMALEALGGALSDINLVPNERAEKRLQTQRARKQQLLAVVGVTAVVAAGVFVHSAMAEQDKRRVKTIDANKEMDKAQKEEKPIQRQHDRVTAFDRVLTTSLDREHPSVDVLVALNRCLPKSSDIWLTQLNFERGGLMTVRGDSKNSRSVTDLLINLQGSGAFTDVRLSYLADAQDTATGNDVVQNTTPKPPVTPLPGLQPTAAPPATGGVPPGGAVPGAPGVASGAPGYGASAPGYGAGGYTPGAAGYNPMGGANPAAGGFNPGAGGFNPAGGGGNPGRGFRGGFNRGGFGTQGGNGTNPGFGGGNPGGGSAPGASNPTQGNQQLVFQPGQAAQGNLPGQVVTTTPGAPVQFPQTGGNPGFQGTVPQGQPTFTQPGGVASPGGGPMVFTPDAGAGGGRRGAFNPDAAAAWRQYRNGVTGGALPSSVNDRTNMAGSGMATGGVGAAVAAPIPVPPVAAPVRKPVAPPKAPKPTLTGFVITCRLRPNAKLIAPGAVATVHNDRNPARVRVTAPVAENHVETDNSDDTGDIE